MNMISKIKRNNFWPTVRLWQICDPKHFAPAGGCICIYFLFYLFITLFTQL